ncbi:MAG: SusC/RagA family TonB-linked outer membrane protein [Gemmatimonadota bacterium]
MAGLKKKLLLIGILPMFLMGISSEAQAQHPEAETPEINRFVSHRIGPDLSNTVNPLVPGQQDRDTPASSSTLTSRSPQQTGVLHGLVTEEDTGRPLPGIQVRVMDSDLGALTNDQGRYRLTGVPAGELSLRAEGLGYRAVTREVTLRSGQTLEVDFELPISAIQMDEVVAVAYGQQTRREIGSSISTVGSDRISGSPMARIDGAIQGRASGVQIIQNSGDPGAGMSIRIRGSSSVSANNQPLWVIDGVPMFDEDFSQLGMGGQNLSGITGISPDDIESISILKDAAATAMYGSRGSNGVVMVRTKRGQTGAPSFTVNTSMGVQDVPNRLDLLNSTEYLEYFNESATNDGYRENYYGAPGVDDAINTDWQEAIFRDAPIGSVDLSVSGGQDRVNYRLSGSYFDQTGVVMGSGYERFNARANVDVNASDRLSLQASLGFSSETTDRLEGDWSLTGIVPMAVAAQPLFPVKLDDGSFQGLGSGFPPDGLNYPNAVAMATYNWAETRTRRAIGNIEARFQLARPLNLTARAGFDILTLRENQWEDPRVDGIYAEAAEGIAKTGFSTGDRFVVDGFLTYEPDIQGQDLTLTAGGTAEMTDRELSFVRGEGFSNLHFNRARNAANPIVADATERSNNLLGIFSRVDYSLEGRYFFTGNFRTDASSRFGPNNRWGYFPGASFVWLVSEESFFPTTGTVQDLRFRVNYGITGNQAISDYPYQGLFGTANYGSDPGLAPSNLGNADLKWERTREFNLGLDASLLGGRLGLEADYYHKKTDDLLLSQPLTGTSGFTSVFANVGGIENRGFELRVNTVNVRASSPAGFEWTSDFNISFNENEVVSLFNDEPFNAGRRNVNRVEVGQPLGAFHMIRFLGVDPETGNAIFSEEREIVGSPHPDFTGGLSNSIHWRGFDLTAFLQFSYGSEIFNAMRLFADAGGWYLDNQFKDVLNRWQEPGDQTNVPRASFNGDSGARELSSRFIEDGSYLRIQEVRLGYELPRGLATAMGASSVQLYVSGQNLHTFTDYMGFTPDVNSDGSSANIGLGTDFYAYPIARAITFGVRGSW